MEVPEAGVGCDNEITLAAPSGISPSLSTTKDCNEKVCAVVLSDGSLLSINLRYLRAKDAEMLSPWGIGGISSR